MEVLLFEKLLFTGIAAVGAGMSFFLKTGDDSSPAKDQKVSMAACLPGPVGSHNSLDGLNSKSLADSAAERTESSSGASSSCALCAGEGRAQVCAPSDVLVSAPGQGGDDPNGSNNLDDLNNLDPMETIDCAAAVRLFECDKQKAYYVKERVEKGYLRGIDPLNDDDARWKDLHDTAVWMFANRLRYECVEYASLVHMRAGLIMRDLYSATRCLKFKHDMPASFRIDNTCHLKFYDTNTNEDVSILDILKMDTTDEGDLRKLDCLGVQFKKYDCRLNETIIDVPFVNSLQKKFVVRYLQERCVHFASERVFLDVGLDYLLGDCGANEG